MARLLLVMAAVWVVVIGADYANHSQQMSGFDSYSQRAAPQRSDFPITKSHGKTQNIQR